MGGHARDDVIGLRPNGTVCLLIADPLISKEKRALPRENSTLGRLAVNYKVCLLQTARHLPPFEVGRTTADHMICDIQFGSISCKYLKL